MFRIPYSKYFIRFGTAKKTSKNIIISKNKYRKSSTDGIFITNPYSLSETISLYNELKKDSSVEWADVYGYPEDSDKSLFILLAEFDRKTEKACGAFIESLKETKYFDIDEVVE